MSNLRPGMVVPSAVDGKWTFTYDVNMGTEAVPRWRKAVWLGEKFDSAHEAKGAMRDHCGILHG